MNTNSEPREEKREGTRRRWWPRRIRLRIVAALLLVLAYGLWRYGWPAQSWETTVCPLEEINWQEAVRLTPECLSPGSVEGGGRLVMMVKGELDGAGRPVFDLARPWKLDQAIRQRQRDILPQLTLPDLAQRRFQAGVFWVDIPAEYEGESADALDPGTAYAVLLSCPEANRWEEAAELIVDFNRNRDLTDDPVLKLSDTWSHRGENPRAEVNWIVRIFDPVTLSRNASKSVGPTEVPATVRAIPAIFVSYYQGESEPYLLCPAFYPTSYRRGQLNDQGVIRDLVVAPDGTRFGRFDGPSPGGSSVNDGGYFRCPLTAWNYARGTFWGCTLDADGRELRDGPYQGPTGMLRVESASGEPLRIVNFALWLRGRTPHRLTSSGWAPIPRFPRLRLALAEHPLPVGDYGITQLTASGLGSFSVVVESNSHPLVPSPKEFTIQDGQTTRFHLPKTLTVQLIAAIEENPRPSTTTWVWSTEPDAPNEPTNPWKGPRPGSKVVISAGLSDSATGNRYALYPRGASSPDSLRLVIADESGKTVHEGTMEYG